MAAQEPDSLAALNAVIRASEPLVPGATQAVLGETSGSEARMTAFSAASESGSCAAMAASARAGTRLTACRPARSPPWRRRSPIRWRR
jgi:hypothetical protein